MKLDSWPAILDSRTRTDRLTKFLKSRTCSSLLDAYAIAYAGQDVNVRTETLGQLESVFLKELARSMKGSTLDIEIIGKALWSQLTTGIRLQFTRLKERRQFDELDILMFATLTGSEGRASAIEGAITERARVSFSDIRSTRAPELVAEIRRLARPAYAEMLLPHARDAHRVRIEDLYVNRLMVQLPLQWVGQHSASDRDLEKFEQIPEEDITDRRFIVIGTPGAGKSTFVRELMYRTCADENSPYAPLYVELKGWTDTKSLAAMIVERLSSHLQITTSVETAEDILTLGLGLVVLDGLDEIVEIGPRRNLVRAIEAFARRYPLCRMAVSCRREGYQAAALNHGMFPAYQIPHFNDNQLERFVRNWFTVVSRFESSEFNEARIGAFLTESVHVAELRRNPLMLSLLCLLFHYDGYIPENRSRIYEECAELMFGRWDSIRGVESFVKSNTRSHHMIEELAIHLFKRQRAQSGESERVLRRLIAEFLRTKVLDDEFLANQQAQQFLDHCAGRAWLLTQVATSRRGERLFGFTHRTFMEYFSACYIARSAPDVTDLVRNLATIIEDDSSDVTAQLALDRFGERVADGLDDAIRVLLFGSRTLEQTVNYRYLGFIARSLEFLQPSPRTMRSIIRAVFREVAKVGGTQGSCFFALPVKVRQGQLQAVLDKTLSEVASSPTAEEILAGAQLVATSIEQISEPGWLLKNAPSSLVSRVASDDVPLETYCSIGGPGCLTTLYTRPSRGKSVHGPLIEVFRECLIRGSVSPMLAKMFRLVVADPTSIMPMSWGAIEELVTDICEADEGELTILGARQAITKQRVVGFTHLSAGLVLESYRHKMESLASPILALSFGESPLLDIHDYDLSSVKLLMAQTPYAEFSKPWLAILRDDD